MSLQLLSSNDKLFENFTRLDILWGGLGGHVERQHAVLHLVQSAQYQLNHRRLACPHGAQQQNRELVLQKVTSDELVSNRVHRRHDYLVERRASVIL